MAFNLPALKELRLPKVPKPVSVLYTPAIVPAFADREFLNGARSARRLKIEHKIKTTPDDRLYWTFISATSRSKLPLSTMRNHFKRRWKEVFIKALKENGFDSHGTRLRVFSGRRPNTDLRGTVEVKLFNACCWENEDGSHMLWISKNIVRGLLDVQRS